MNPTIVEQPAMTVIGITARTNNAREATSDGVIPRLWQRFAEEGVLAKIPHKSPGTVIAVYMDYTSDENGDYTYLLGAPVVGLAEAPTGMALKLIPAGQYAEFTTEKGPVQKVVPEAWRRIWSTPREALGGRRAYQADFEIYGDGAKDPQSATVQLFVGIVH